MSAGSPVLVTKATCVSVDTARLLEIFGLQGRYVTRIVLDVQAGAFMQLNVTCEISEDELRALCDELEKNPPVERELIGVTQHR